VHVQQSNCFVVMQDFLIVICGFLTSQPFVLWITDLGNTAGVGLHEGHQVKVKVTGANKHWKFLFLQCKTLTGNNSACITHRSMKSAYSMEFSAMADQMEWLPSLSHNRKWPSYARCRWAEASSSRIQQIVIDKTTELNNLGWRHQLGPEANNLNIFFVYRAA